MAASAARPTPAIDADGDAVADEAARLARRNDRVVANLGLVLRIARDAVAADGRGVGLEAADLAQAGVFGLMRAAEKFDPGRGTRFGTYATFWVRRYVDREIAAGRRPVRLPEYTRTLFEHFRGAAAAMADARGAEPDDEDVIDALGVPAGSRATTRAIMASCRATFVGDAGTLERLPDPRGADGPGDDGDRPTVPDDLDDRLRGYLDRLDGRRRLALTLRYGLDGGPPRTFAAIGGELGVTKTRADQLVVSAIARLRVMYGVVPDAPGKSHTKRRIGDVPDD